MTEPPQIIIYLDQKFKELKKNNGLKALVTAGPTKEFIDPVRYITNKSSGKQGYEIANSLKEVDLIQLLYLVLHNLIQLKVLKQSILIQQKKCLMQ